MPTAEALAWARRAFPGLDPASARPLPPAGSSRTLTRLLHTGGSLVLVENPVEVTAAVNENDAFGYLAAHLGARGIPVPGVLAYKRSRGWSLVEDLGDRDLCAEVRRALHGPPPRGDDREAREHIAALYREALEVLVRLQVDGVAGFDPRRTHNPPRYDVALMRQGESGYFVRELVGHHLGLERAARAGRRTRSSRRPGRRAGAPYLLHRDYQSQNLKIHLGRICVIDFQGARLGPAQYDLAALLLDPYADLPADLRRELLEHYLGLFTARTGEERGRFLERFPFVAAHRLMQALGAYAFLGLRRGKPAFLAHIPAALRLLEETSPRSRTTLRVLAAIVCRGAAAGAGGRGRRRHAGRRGPGPGRMRPSARPPRAMVLAAGLGTRLRPLTNAIPKPLVPIANRPLLEYTFALLAGAGVREAIVNTHHLPDIFEAGLRDLDASGLDLHVSRERRILGTAGGLKKAESFLGAGTFLLLNGDFLVDIDLRQVLDFHQKQGAAATMVLMPDDDAGVLGVDPDGVIRRFIEPRPAGEPAERLSCGFTGIHVLEPEVFPLIPANKPWEINRQVYPELIARGRRVCGFVHRGYWREAGSPAGYLAANREVAGGRAGALAPRPGAGASTLAGAACSAPVLAGHGVRVGADVEVGPETVIGPEVRIGDGARLRRSVILEGTDVPAGADLDGVALFPGGRFAA